MSMSPHNSIKYKIERDKVRRGIIRLQMALGLLFSSVGLAGAPIVMFINIYAGESPIRKTCNFDKPLNHILKVMDGCMHIFCLVKHQNTQN